MAKVNSAGHIFSKAGKLKGGTIILDTYPRVKQAQNKIYTKVFLNQAAAPCTYPIGRTDGEIAKKRNKGRVNLWHVCDFRHLPLTAFLSVSHGRQPSH